MNAEKWMGEAAQFDGCELHQPRYSQATMHYISPGLAEELKCSES